MSKIPIRKITAFLFFIIIVALTFVLYIQQDTKLNDSDSVLVFGGIFLSALFLLILNLTKTEKIVKHIYKQENKKAPEEKSVEQNLNIEEKTEHYIVEILKDLGKRNDLKSLSEQILKNLAESFNIVQGIFYVKNKNNGKFFSSATYAFFSESEKLEFIEGEGLNGQAASDKEIKLITDIAEGYLVALSGLGSCSPRNLLLIPFIYNDETIALAEIAAFEPFPENLSGIYKGINEFVTKNLTKYR